MDGGIERSDKMTRGMNNVPRNAWYVVAGIEELGEPLLSRRIANIPLVLFRTGDGEAIALHDRCPHRLMPLSLGKRIDDEIQCLYHGLQFDRSGRCTKIPTQDAISKALAVRRYPLIEKSPFIWVWVGEEGKEDPSLIPNTERVRPHYSQIFHFCYPIKSDFLLMHENLMDTSHPTYLHAGYFDDGQLVRSPFKVETERNVVRLIREVGLHIPGEGTTRFFNLDPGKPVYQTTITETHAPSLNVILYRFSYPDRPERAPIEYIALAPISPSGPRLCYHFVASCTSWPLAPSKEMNAMIAKIIEGDQLALEAIEERRDEMQPGDSEVHIRADAASLKLRRLIQSMAEHEHR
jgi:vanillate O-demethylase monooxygenase subunit